MSAWNLANAAVFQLAWFACVVGGARQTSVWGISIVAALMVFALLGPSLGRDLMLAAAAALVGCLLDTMWIHTGVLDYGGAGVAPLWIVLLWAAVGLTVNHCLSLFKARPWLGGALAGAGAPLSYLAGERFGAVAVPEPWLLAWVALVWFALFSLIFLFAGRNEPAGTATRSDHERPH